jgi:uncharacterized protein
MLHNQEKWQKWWVYWKRKFRYYYLRLMRLKGQPEEVAGGVAIGVFIGMTPTVPLHTILAVVIAFLAGKSKLAAALGAWICNPLFLPFIYILDYKVGQSITGSEGLELSFAPEHLTISHLLEVGREVSFSLLMGGLITGLMVAIPSYFVTKRLVILYRKRKRKEPRSN